MRALFLLLALSVLLPAGISQADDVTKDRMIVKEINLKGLKLNPMRGRFGQPKEITSAEELARLFPDEEAQNRIKKEVDFTRVKLLYFAWSGSGQDRVTGTVKEEDNKTEVVFTFQPGRTKDLRTHHRLFAVGPAIPWRVAP
jgi:hypothetical protein